MIFPLYDDNPTGQKPLLTIALIGVMTAIFFAVMSAESPFSLAAIGWLVPARLFAGGDAAGALWPPLTLISYQFLHVDIWHLGGNMVALWVFAHIGGFLAGMALVWPCKRPGIALFRPRGDPDALTRWAVKKNRKGLGVWLMKHSIGGRQGEDAAAEAWNPAALRDVDKEGNKDR